MKTIKKWLEHLKANYVELDRVTFYVVATAWLVVVVAIVLLIHAVLTGRPPGRLPWLT